MIFPIFWKKIEKNLRKNSNFFLICVSELEKAYVQLMILNFFSDFDLNRIDFEKISKQNAFSSSEKEKKGWGTDFHFFNILSKILF